MYQISNSWNEGASKIILKFDLVRLHLTRKKKIVVEIIDDGDGMSSAKREGIGLVGYVSPCKTTEFMPLGLGLNHVGSMSRSTIDKLPSWPRCHTGKSSSGM